MPIAIADAVAGRALQHESFPASVTITRTSQDDFSSRQLIVWIDGERVATLLWGDSISRDLEPGVHRVRVSNTLVWKTAEFTIEPGQQVFFEAINRTGAGTLTMMLLLGVAPLYVTLKRMDI
jgi:hypothetical protein